MIEHTYDLVQNSMTNLWSYLVAKIIPCNMALPTKRGAGLSILPLDRYLFLLDSNMLTTGWGFS